jgi:predicted O-linked N-acetylglucosamine transferase (SPINDLY family)
MHSDIQNIMTQAIQYHQNGDYDHANQLYQKILISDPQNADALHYSGVIAMQHGKMERAIQLITRAIEICPDISGFHSNLALAYKDNDQLDSALDHYKKAVDLNPNNPVIYFNLGALYQNCSQYENAQIAYEKSLKMNPNQPLLYHNLGHLFLKMGYVQNAITSAKKAMALSPYDPEIQSNYLFALNYSIKHSPENIINEHLKWGQKYQCSIKSDIHKSSRIHVGYVSPDFRDHSVSKFIQAILKHHDTKYFNIYCYSNVKKPDHVTNALIETDVKWRDIYYQDDQAVCDQIKSDGIHILVDLAGHSSNNRLMVFAKKPAPIQVSYLGYPNTTGLSQIDYRFVDQHSDPDLSRFSGSEHRMYLPYGFLCYSPSPHSPLITKKSFSKHTVFGSFNNLPKINQHVIVLWSKILKAVPDSRLLLKTHGFKVNRIKEEYLNNFKGQGIDPSRIQLLASVKKEKDHLSLYDEIDIALDTFPYNGTTTTCEALWMGVPVITLSGEIHAARVGESILNQTGLNVWIAKNETDYIKKAIYLAAHPDERNFCRQNLRDWLTQSLLCRKDLFLKALETQYYQFMRHLFEGL